MFIGRRDNTGEAWFGWLTRIGRIYPGYTSVMAAPEKAVTRDHQQITMAFLPSGKALSTSFWKTTL